MTIPGRRPELQEKRSSVCNHTEDFFGSLILLRVEIHIINDIALYAVQ